jgi:outer membrane protein assembly factor BamB
MRLWASLAAGLGLFISHANAVYTDEAYVVDWQKDQIGLLKPEFTVWLENGLIASLTDANVLAVLNSTTGDIQWRRQLDKEVTGLAAAGDQVFTAMKTDTDGAVISAWSLTKAILSWNVQLNEPVTTLAVTSNESGITVGSAGKLQGLGTDSGARLWEVDVKGSPVRGIAIDKSSVFVMQERGKWETFFWFVQLS